MELRGWSVHWNEQGRSRADAILGARTSCGGGGAEKLGRARRVRRSPGGVRRSQTRAVQRSDRPASPANPSSNAGRWNRWTAPGRTTTRGGPTAGAKVAAAARRRRRGGDGKVFFFSLGRNGIWGEGVGIAEGDERRRARARTRWWGGTRARTAGSTPRGDTDGQCFPFWCTMVSKPKGFVTNFSSFKLFVEFYSWLWHCGVFI
jgi:hypothetical protein